jgi:multiple sugar transport system permease protein
MNPARHTRYTQKAMIVAMVIAGLVMATPFYFLAIFATHSRAEIFSLPPPLWIGDQFWSNLAGLSQKIPYLFNALLSVYIALMSSVLTVIVSAMAGYALVYLNFKYKRMLVALVLSLMMLPPFLSMIPTFIIMDGLRWLDEPRALYIPAAASAFGVFLIRQYAVNSISKDIIEAARMDGATEWRIFMNIFIPLLMPALSVLGLISFIASWNNFSGALVVLRSSSHFTIPLALRSLLSPVNTEWGVIMVGSLLATLPLLVIYALFSKKIISGLTATLLK